MPAVFGRLVHERFYELEGDQAVIKVTAPPHLVRNRKARPDDWEIGVIADHLTSEDWPRNKIFAAEADYKGQPAYRVLVPEYYSEGCIACHGGPKGEIDVTGYPKEGGAGRRPRRRDQHKPDALTPCMTRRLFYIGMC